jgi:hypothetical protein
MQTTNRKASVSSISNQGLSKWPMLAIPSTWKAEIRKITVQSQHGQIVHETSISKITRIKWAKGMALA